MIRKCFVWLHRWFGLFMAVFLIIEGLTGSLLAFHGELTRLLAPRLFVTKPSPDAKILDLASLAECVEGIDPTITVGYFAGVGEDRAVVRCAGKKDSKTGRQVELDFMYMVLDPYTGNELARLRWCGYVINGNLVENIMPFVFDLHSSLALGRTGSWILASVAVVWSLDCFIAFYLTLPVTYANFFQRWKIAWLVKLRAGYFRANYDLHRAGGLWFWIMLFVFAWSSVHLIDNFGVFDKVMGFLFRTPVFESMTEFFPNRPLDDPRLKWREAQAAGQKLMADNARKGSFAIVRPVGLNYFASSGLYNYCVETDRYFPQDREAIVFFDAETGELHGIMSSTNSNTTLTVTNWLRALHMAKDPVGYLPYRILVSLTGIVCVLLSVTGVYIWWKKRQARMNAASRKSPSLTIGSPVLPGSP